MYSSGCTSGSVSPDFAFPVVPAIAHHSPRLPADRLTAEPAAQLFPIAAQDFKQWIMRGVDERLRDALMAAELGEAEDALFNLFARFVLANFNDQIKTYR